MMTRNEMIEQLQVKECRVVFTKINGETRDMQCTLMETALPVKATPSQVTEAEALTAPKARKVNLDTVVAWDVNKEDFRTFRVENVVSFT
tara:strand:+ start:2531 stop:2800 length:270 start_codon:yes stop_codon:yes gene_type:complete